MHSINSSEAPEIIGTYSQAIRIENTVYFSGQIGLDPSSMIMCSEQINLQMEQVLNNLSAVCKKAGGSLKDIVKINFYLTDLSHFSLLNDLMSRYFSAPFPARTTVGVAALPRGALVEADAIMVLS